MRLETGILINSLRSLSEDAAPAEVTSDATPEKQGGETAAADAGNGQQAAPPPDTGMMPMLLLMVAIFAIFIIFSRRSQKRQQAERESLMKALKPGEKVMLSSGLFGRVEKVDAEGGEVRLVIDEDKKVVVTYSLLAVAKVVEEEVSSIKKDDRP